MILYQVLKLDKLPNANANSFTHTELKQAMLDTISTLNVLAEEQNVTEVRSFDVAGDDSFDILILSSRAC